VSFYVEPGAVSGLALLVLRNAEGMHGHHELICRSAPSDWSEGILLNLVAPKLDEMQERAKLDTGRAASLLATCGAELEAGAAYYADANNRAKLAIEDAKYPYEGIEPREIERGEVADPGGAERFDDAEPLDRDPRHPERSVGPGPYPLPEPTEQDGAGEEWALPLENVLNRLTSAASMAGHVRGVLVQLLGLDPFDVVLRFVAGDWEPVMRNGMALQNLGQVGNWLATNVERGLYAVQDRWAGNAADAAAAWLQQYTAAARGLALWGAQAGFSVQNFASTAYHAFEAMDGYLNLIIDILIDVVAKIPGLIGGGIAMVNAESFEEMMDAIASMMMAWSELSTIIDSLTARAHEFLGIASNHSDGSRPVTSATWPPELGGFNREEF
jgi:hypothetical protein